MSYEAMQLNLLPRKRRIRLQRTRHLLRAGGMFMVGAGVLLAVGALQLRELPKPKPLPRTPAQIQAELDDVQQAYVEQHKEFVVAAQNMRAIDTIVEQPDWSVLLKLVADAAQTRAVLDTYELIPPKDGQGYRLRLVGLALTHAEVSQFVLELEGLRLFASVNVGSTARQPTPRGECVKFTAECVLLGGE